MQPATGSNNWPPTIPTATSTTCWETTITIAAGSSGSSKREQGGNFSWHRFYFRLGDAVFLHGDVADRWMTASMLVAARAAGCIRAAQPIAPPRLRPGVPRRLHTPLPYLVHRKRRVARRILAYLRISAKVPPNGVRRVFFGHIHRRVANYRYGGLTFHNGGASIRGQRLHILEMLI